MALNDITLASTSMSSASAVEVKVQDRTSSSDTVMYPGDPVKISGAESGNYALHLATGDPEIGTDIALGFCTTESTETSTADGVVNVHLFKPGELYKCKASTPANLATGILFDTVTFDLSSTTFTVDEDEGSDENVHGLRIMSYDADGYVYFIVKPAATYLDCSL